MTNVDRAIPAGDKIISTMKFENQTFTNQNVNLDANSFENCKFYDVVLVYHGGQPPNLVDCEFGNFKILFAEAAGNTVLFMKALYEGGFAQVIDQTIDNIRGKAGDQPPDILDAGLLDES
jgi:hypothetical protein